MAQVVKPKVCDASVALCLTPARAVLESTSGAVTAWLSEEDQIAIDGADRVIECFPKYTDRFTAKRDCTGLIILGIAQQGDAALKINVGPMEALYFSYAHRGRQRQSDHERQHRVRLSFCRYQQALFFIGVKAAVTWFAGLG
ncbi:hypothetical protein SAHL_02575 [Salinisphaera orenii YIM 95161]|uniref:Uncharacterized protein n=1 Tax=Salinisphaera orenii YIM 95161 TaxID=1051139 RepID=A0A423Q829_9GAMM|nr:hypothetical protein SAHL_02575 [Salinisphaera halophila YIM 95161]